MTKRGAIWLHRDILHHWVFRDENLLKVWLWCLLKATWQPLEQYVREGHVLLPGQFWTGRFRAAAELEMNPSTVRDRLKALADADMIRLEPDTKGTTITIVNWARYQQSTLKDDSVPTPIRQRSDSVPTQNNNTTIQEQSVSHFERLWALYPRREGKKAAARHYQAQVTTTQDVVDLERAIRNYIAVVEQQNLKARRPKGDTTYMKHGSTFFNNWRDYVNIDLAPVDRRKAEDIAKIRKEAGID